MRKKNISLFNISLSSGGAEKVISLLLKKLIEDYNVTLILLYNNIHFKIPKEVNVIVIFKDTNTTNLSSIKKFKDAFLSPFYYIKIIKKEKISVAISFLALPNFINSIAKILRPKLKTIISERGFPSDNTSNPISKYISKIFYPILYNRNNHLFSNSVYINKDLLKNFKIKIPMSVIYNPIELPEIKKDKKTALNFFKIVNVGSLNPRKNQSLIINAIPNSKNDFKLDIYGNGAYKNVLNKLINDIGQSNNIILKGNVKNVQQYLIDYDCFVLSSNTEGFPNALLEAMAVGLACISTNCLSGPLELLHDNTNPIVIDEGCFFKGKYGLLINNNDVIGLQKALLFFKENKSIRIKYGELAMEKAKKFELHNIYPEYKILIEQ